MTQLSSFLMDLRLCSLLTSCCSFTWQQRTSNSAHNLCEQGHHHPHPGLSEASVFCTDLHPTPGDLRPPVEVPSRSRSGAVAPVGSWDCDHRCWAHMHSSQQSSCLLLHKVLCKLLGLWAPSVSCAYWTEVLKEHHTDSNATCSVNGKNKLKLMALV